MIGKLVENQQEFVDAFAEFANVRQTLTEEGHAVENLDNFLIMMGVRVPLRKFPVFENVATVATYEDAVKLTKKLEEKYPNYIISFATTRAIIGASASKIRPFCR